MEGEAAARQSYCLPRRPVTVVTSQVGHTMVTPVPPVVEFVPTVSIAGMLMS